MDKYALLCMRMPPELEPFLLLRLLAVVNMLLVGLLLH